MANVLILKYQALFQIGLEPLHLECWKKQNNYSQHLSAQKKEDQVRHVQNIKILAIALKVKMHSKSLQMGPSEETALGTYRAIDKNDCKDLLPFSTTNQCDLIRPYLFFNSVDNNHRDEHDPVWCFLENVRDPANPESGCYKDTRWSAKDGRFWSARACDGLPPIEASDLVEVSI